MACGWWADRDSNPDSKDYESSALTVKLSARCGSAGRYQGRELWEKVRGQTKQNPESLTIGAIEAGSVNFPERRLWGHEPFLPDSGSDDCRRLSSCSTSAGFTGKHQRPFTCTKSSDDWCGFSRVAVVLRTTNSALEDVLGVVFTIWPAEAFRRISSAM